MGIPDGAHTHGSGDGLGTAVLVVLAAALAVKLAGPVLTAVSELLQMVLIAAAVIVGVSAAGLVALLTWRWHHRHTDAARATLPHPGAVTPLHGVARAAQPLPQARQAPELPSAPAHELPAAFTCTSTA
jgi:hypothetical protein